MRLDLGYGDSAAHLAAEEYLLGPGASCAPEPGFPVVTQSAALPPDAVCTLLYESRPAVVIGSGQITHAEANDAANTRGVPVVRRISGGGAVYHGPGCLCFARILPCPDPKTLSLADCLAPVLAALRSLGVPAQTSHRHDILLSGKKLGGTAARLGRDRVLFHGTLLFDADLDALRAVLGPESRYLFGKGVASVPSPVTSLRESGAPFARLADFRAALLDALAPGEETLVFSGNAREERKLLAEKYASWEWNAGRNPDCRMALPLSDGTAAVLSLHRDRIVRCEHENDALCKALLGLPYRPDALEEAAARFSR